MENCTHESQRQRQRQRLVSVTPLNYSFDKSTDSADHVVETAEATPYWNLEAMGDDDFSSGLTLGQFVPVGI